MVRPARKRVRAAAMLLPPLVAALAIALAAPAASPAASPAPSWDAEVAADTGRAVASARTAADPYAWARRSITFTASAKLLPPKLTQAPQAVVTRAAFAKAIVRFETWRAAATGEPRQVPTARGARLKDVAQKTVYARLVKLGWMNAHHGRFDGRTPITSDEAARAVVGVLHERQSARLFAARLKSELPGITGTNLQLRAAQVYTRTLGLRYNNLQGTEQQEVAPSEAMHVTHVAYMLNAASAVQPWQLSQLTPYETFDIPSLTANQKKALYLGVRFIGWPYVWGGETEGTQAEGHGGFDCSGFVWRTVMFGDVPRSDQDGMTARTTFDMSDMPKASRIAQEQLQPGDLLFFGEKGPRSTPQQNYHVGVWMGNGWFIHSTGSNDGVSISQLTGYWADHFAWGRRVITR